MDDLSFLVNETFAHQKQTSSFYPSEPGLVFHLQATSTMYVVRALATGNIHITAQDILEYPENYPSLRLINMESDQLQFFPTTNLLQAQTLQQILAHKRFPQHEELVCNMSDPGFSWWMVKTAEGLVISKKLISLELDQATKLGDLGDPDVLSFMFQKLAKLLKVLPGDWSSFAQDKRLVMKGPADHFLLIELENFFRTGFLTSDLDHALDFLGHKAGLDQDELWSLKDFLKDLAIIRQFWIKIFHQLDKVSR
jgi:hypothetical protein